MVDAASDCRDFEADLSALLDGELAPERAAELRAHVAGCDGCRGRLAGLARVDAALAGAPAPAVPASLRARLEARLEGAGQADTRLRRTRRAWRGRAAGALAAAATGAALYLVVATREPALAPAQPPLDRASVPEEDLGLALEIETVEDLDVIANLELLELVVAAEAGG
ncbi:MAG TPA: zf-HC2 domain-containing protein [Myxococcota bacterium]|jgi:anti-sigma factor RsiW